MFSGIMLMFVGISALGQEPILPILAPPVRTAPATTLVTDTDTIPDLQESDLDKIIDLRTRFIIQNRSYSKPSAPSRKVQQILEKEDGKLKVSPEFLYWVSWKPDPEATIPEWYTLRDTVIVSNLFLPLVFRGKIVDESLMQPTPPTIISSYEEIQKKPPTGSSEISSWITDKITRNERHKAILRYMETNHPTAFRYTEKDLPKEIVKPVEIVPNLSEAPPIIVEREVKKPDDYDGPVKFIPERRYWQSFFESAVQFSQTHVSKNWHKGGTSNLNLYTRNHLKYNYKKDKVELTNEMELKTSFYTAPKDTLRDYKIGDDLFRIHSNLGLQAFKKWFYTFDAEFKTQMFRNYLENSETKVAALLSPFTVTVGVGMKYDLHKTFPAKKHKSVRLSINVAPLSYSYMYTINDDIDMARHGFKKIPDSDKFENSLSRFGANLRADLTFDFNRNVRWQSRFYYFTSYNTVVSEFENTLTMAISRFFSTRIYFHLRYDDAVAPSKKDSDLGYFQLNELLSFGFNYKW